MSKKHIIQLANVIKNSRGAFSDAAIVELANFCQSQNSNFKRDRFFDNIAGNCGPNGGKL